MATPAAALTRCRPLSAPLRDRKSMSLFPEVSSPQIKARPYPTAHQMWSGVADIEEQDRK
jgi:hypothetical protein